MANQCMGSEKNDPIPWFEAPLKSKVYKDGLFVNDSNTSNCKYFNFCLIV